MDRVKPVAKTETAKSGLWCNWYQAILDCDPNFIPRRTGEIFPGADTYETREDAEWAYEAMTVTRRALWDGSGQGDRGEPCVYLGARQDGGDV